MRDSFPINDEAGANGLLGRMRRRQAGGAIAEAALRCGGEGSAPRRLRPGHGAFNRAAATLLVKWKDM